MKEILVTIPESIVREAAEECKDDNNNGFLRCLMAGEEFRAAGLTPIYILDGLRDDLAIE
jgi:hypothetical protein